MMTTAAVAGLVSREQPSLNGGTGTRDQEERDSPPGSFTRRRNSFRLRSNSFKISAVTALREKSPQQRGIFFARGCSRYLDEEETDTSNVSSIRPDPGSSSPIGGSPLVRAAEKVGAPAPTLTLATATATATKSECQKSRGAARKPNRVPRNAVAPADARKADSAAYYASRRPGVRKTPWWIVDPRKGRARRPMVCWDVATTLALLYTALLTPYEVAFLDPPPNWAAAIQGARRRHAAPAATLAAAPATPLARAARAAAAAAATRTPPRTTRRVRCAQMGSSCATA